MIKDKNGNTADIAEIKVELRDEMVSYIQNRIIRNVEAIKEFLQIPGYEDICAGLYTYAVEEYGKILFLNSFSLSSYHTLPPFWSWKKHANYQNNEL
jgi:hypothetical protein